MEKKHTTIFLAAVTVASIGANAYLYQQLNIANANNAAMVAQLNEQTALNEQLTNDIAAVNDKVAGLEAALIAANENKLVNGQFMLGDELLSFADEGKPGIKKIEVLENGERLITEETLIYNKYTGVFEKGLFEYKEGERAEAKEKQREQYVIDKAFFEEHGLQEQAEAEQQENREQLDQLLEDQKIRDSYGTPASGTVRAPWADDPESVGATYDYDPIAGSQESVNAAIDWAIEDAQKNGSMWNWE